MARQTNRLAGEFQPVVKMTGGYRTPFRPAMPKNSFFR
jgi:hypothetical protein